MKTFLRSLFVAVSVSTLLQVSSFASIQVTSGLIRTKTVQPGETFDGTVVIRNTDARPAQVRIRQSDYQSFADGRNIYADPGSTPHSNANWISIAPSQLTVGGNEAVTVNYKARVPLDAKLAGTYWSLLLVEPVAPPAPEAKGAQGEVAVGLQTVIRFGVQIITEIGVTGTHTMKIGDKALLHEDGRRSLKLDFQNTGERDMIPSVGVELYGQDGVLFGKFEGGRKRIYPGGSARYRVDLTNVPRGKYVAMVIADTGDINVMGAQYELEIAD